jgi:hypothetical protein
MKKLLLIFFFCFIAIALDSCLQTENSSTSDANSYGGLDPNNPSDVLFAEAKEVWRVSCTPCHAFNGLSKDELVSAGLVIEGDPQDSKIYYRMRNSAGPMGSKNMPPAGSLTSGDIQVVSDWISSL